MGLFEDDRFRGGTTVLLEYLAEMNSQHKTNTVVGGGDTEPAIQACYPKAAGNLRQISTGGGAMLAALAGETLPGFEVLDTRE